MRKAHDLTLRVYSVSREFPRDEKFGLTSQLRRAAVSIELNTAEGAGRRTDKDFAHFLDHATGSATEVECALLIARDLGMLRTDITDDMDRQVNEVKRMLYGFCSKLRGKR